MDALYLQTAAGMLEVDVHACHIWCITRYGRSCVAHHELSPFCTLHQQALQVMGALSQMSKAQNFQCIVSASGTQQGQALVDVMSS